MGRGDSSEPPESPLGPPLHALVHCFDFGLSMVQVKKSWIELNVDFNVTAFSFFLGYQNRFYG